MSMEEKRKVTRAERATTVGPLDRPAENLEKPLPSTSDKPLPAITESVIDDSAQLNLHDPASIDQELRTALTDPRIFETVPAAFSLSFVLGKQPADPDSLSLAELLSQGQYYLIILRTQHLLTTSSTPLSIPELWSLWLLRAESLRALLAPRLAALELNRIKVPEKARIPWDFQVIKILLVGMASGRWTSAVNEWVKMSADTRVGLTRAEEKDKELWTLRLRKLEDLCVYALIESKDYELAERYLNGLIKRHPKEQKHNLSLFHLYLQMGLFTKAESLLPSLPTDIHSEATALFALAKSDFPTAVQKYTSLLDSHPHHLAHSNNLALTHLYMANGQAGIATLEPNLREPGHKVGVLPHSVYNLCTMYEIRDDKARSRKEGVMESIVGRYGDVCGKAHFKLDSLR